jgi:peptide/nickel transport system substrate-binding protein
MKRTARIAALFASALIAAPAIGADLRIGLQEDPDVLDPHQARTFVGRIVFAALCDKLVDITPDLKIVPMLATSWEWSADGKALTMNLRDGVTFHDGTPFDAAAVVANIERARGLKESRRKSEVASVESIAATGPLQVRFALKAPDATLLAQLADRAGMMMSPKALAEKGLDLGSDLVCSGPFRFVERVQQDRIVVEKFAGYWDAARIHIDKVTYLPIPDTTVRLANLRSGDLDLIERLAATDAASVKADASLTYMDIVGIGYQGITVNVGNGDRAKAPSGQDARVRQALSLAIDRDALVQVVFEGTAAPGNQPYPSNSPWFNGADPVRARDVAAAKALLKAAGHEKIAIEMQVTNTPVQAQIAQVLQAMVAEAGIELKLKSMEFASLLSDQSAGNYELSLIGWSGRVDPDGNLHQFATCKGGINDSKYCNPKIDELLNAARTSTDAAVRKLSYDAAQAILSADLPIVYLYHPNWIWALRKTVTGFVAYPDGMIRLQDMKVN